MVLITLGLIVLGLTQLICLLALVDQYKGLLQIRNDLRLSDIPHDLSLIDGKGVRASAAGLPAAVDAEELAVVVIFSTKCTACVTVARGLKGGIPPPGWALIAAGSEEQCQDFQRQVGLTGDRILMDVGGRIADNLNVRTFPSAVVFSNGEPVRAETIPSYRQLRRVLKESVARRAEPNGGASG
jgi:hypothetical protein